MEDISPIILQYIEYKDLCRWHTVSHKVYRLCHNDELWKQLYIDHCAQSLYARQPTYYENFRDILCIRHQERLFWRFVYNKKIDT